MIRTLSTIAALAPLAAGCIVYEDRQHRDEPCGRDRGCTVTTPLPPDDGEPEPGPEPELTDALVLTVSEGSPGQTLLSMLTPLSAEMDLSSVVSVSFDRDIEIVDSQIRPFELVLALSVDPEAALGEVEVSVETEQGPGFVLDQPFRIVAGEGSATGTASDTGSP